jgi:hypothetical protein
MPLSYLKILHFVQNDKLVISAFVYDNLFVTDSQEGFSPIVTSRYP